MDLGFYMLCPNFFSDFYTANRWQIEANYLCEYYAYWHGGRLHSDRWKVYEYRQGCLDALSYGRYGGAQAASFVVARKSEQSTGDVVPQLGQYQRTWEEFEAKKDDPDPWYTQVVKFLCGDITEKEFLDSARAETPKKTSERRCEAFFYAGAMREVAGQPKEARKLYLECARTGVRNFIEYETARIGLKRIPR